MASYMSAGEAFAREQLTSNSDTSASSTTWANKFRGATIEDLDPPPALSVSSNDSIGSAMLAAYERDFTHLTVVSSTKRSLLGYLSIPRLKELLKEGAVKESDSVSVAMQRFNRKRGTYEVITMETPLEDLQKFFDSETSPTGEKRQKQDFAVVTDASRKFVLGVATRADLEEFVKRRP
ncbi:hypothetical protein FE257_000493 [Aspergillus nanangensis]|uniref:Cystathionine beta-synthase n=1 Tax=Aspergillus nanangensis TaxID=2582783 RepID=A0AAD4GXH9_ASPNN|nr:hypothetical protein FE257_000493 [Aspergillus nanangensis]